MPGGIAIEDHRAGLVVHAGVVCDPELLQDHQDSDSENSDENIPNGIFQNLSAELQATPWDGHPQHGQGKREAVTVLRVGFRAT